MGVAARTSERAQPAMGRAAAEPAHNSGHEYAAGVDALAARPG